MTGSQGLTEPTTKQATVAEVLLRLVQDQRRIADMAEPGWEGDLDAMREGQGFGPPA